MKPRIAIVEDEPAIAEVLQYNLDREGFAVEILARGDLALEAIRKNPPDLVLLDLMLPGIDGLEITRFLKRDKATAGIPLVMITARDSETASAQTSPKHPRIVAMVLTLRHVVGSDGPWERAAVARRLSSLTGSVAC